MSLSGAVEWWEEWKLRILVLSSLFIQWLLFLSASQRKHAIPSFFRTIIWLSYLGSDALAIYALATLFNRQSRQDCRSGQGNSILEVVWAPVLLIHLGGQDLITAYNIEDNELWTRYVFTSISQVTVAIYVFCKSWPGGDMRLLLASICLFVVGILKSFEKPWALKCASINSLVSSSDPAARWNTGRKGGTNSLQDYVKNAREFVQTIPRRQAQEEGDAVDLEIDNHLPQAQGEEDCMDAHGAAAMVDLPQAQGEDLDANNQPRAHGEAAMVDPKPDNHPLTLSRWIRDRINKEKEFNRRANIRNKELTKMEVDEYNKALEVYKQFVDLASPYDGRLRTLKFIWVFDRKQTCDLLQNRLSEAFSLLYTKRKMLGILDIDPMENRDLSQCARILAAFLPWAAISLFHKSHRDAYNANDVKVTYALLCCTAVLEICCSYMSMRDLNFFGCGRARFTHASVGRWVMLPLEKLVILIRQPRMMKFLKKLHSILSRISTMVPLKSSVGQCNLVGFFAYNKRGSWKMCMLNFLGQHWSMKPCSFHVTNEIIGLVLKYVKKGWEDEDQIKDADSYWKFNDRRGQWTLQANKCDQDLGWSLRSPFDESVLLWHIATDFCFYYMGASADHQCATAQYIQDASGEGHGCAIWCERSPHHGRAVQCRELSNYMIYLLFVNPEMLLPGTRRNLFTTANAELENILKDDIPLLKKILEDNKPPFMEILKCKEPFVKEIERGFMQKIIAKVQPKENREQVVENMDLPPDVETGAPTQEGFIFDAWKLANGLLHLGDEKKMWEVIEGVWVEMLCFSASRCRGYLHAKSLGTGPELLTYIWLLLSQMGMETLPERLQRMELPTGEGNASATPSTYQIPGSEDPAPFGRSRPHEAATAGASTSRPQEIQPAE